MPRLQSRLLKHASSLPPTKEMMAKMKNLLLKKGFTPWGKYFLAPNPNVVVNLVDWEDRCWYAYRRKGDDGHAIGKGDSYGSLALWIAEYLEGNKTDSVKQAGSNGELAGKMAYFLLRKGFTQKDIFTYVSSIDPNIEVYLFCHPASWVARDMESQEEMHASGRGYRRSKDKVTGTTYSELVVWVNDHLQTGKLKQAAQSSSPEELAAKMRAFLLKKGFTAYKPWGVGRESAYRCPDNPREEIYIGVDKQGAFWSHTDLYNITEIDPHNDIGDETYASLVVYVEERLGNSAAPESKTASSDPQERCHALLLRKGFQQDPRETERYFRPGSSSEIRISPGYWDYWSDAYVRRPTESGESYSSLVLFLADLTRKSGKISSSYEEDDAVSTKIEDWLLKKGFVKDHPWEDWFGTPNNTLFVWARYREEDGDPLWIATTPERQDLLDRLSWIDEPQYSGNTFAELVSVVTNLLPQGKTSSEKSHNQIRFDKLCDYLLKKGFHQRDGSSVFFLASDTSLAVYVHSGDYWAAKRRASNFVQKDLASGDTYASLVAWVSEYLEQQGTGKISSSYEFIPKDKQASNEDDETAISAKLKSMLLRRKMKAILVKSGFKEVSSDAFCQEDNKKLVVYILAEERWSVRFRIGSFKFDTIAFGSTYAELVVWVNDYLEKQGSKMAKTKTSSMMTPEEKEKQLARAHTMLLRKGLTESHRPSDNPDDEHNTNDDNYMFWYRDDLFVVLFHSSYSSAWWRVGWRTWESPEDKRLGRSCKTGEKEGDSYADLVLCLNEHLPRSEGKTSAQEDDTLWQTLNKMKAWILKQGFKESDPWPYWFASPEKDLYVWLDMHLESYDEEAPCLWWADKNAVAFDAGVTDPPDPLAFGSTYAELVAFVTEHREGQSKTSAAKTADGSLTLERATQLLTRRGLTPSTHNPKRFYFSSTRRPPSIFVGNIPKVGTYWMLEGHPGLQISGQTYSSLVLFLTEYENGVYEDEKNWPDNAMHHLGSEAASFAERAEEFLLRKGLTPSPDNRGNWYDKFYFSPDFDVEDHVDSDYHPRVYIRKASLSDRHPHWAALVPAGSVTGDSYTIQESNPDVWEIEGTSYSSLVLFINEYLQHTKKSTTEPSDTGG
jgi:hypothetical protein